LKINVSKYSNIKPPIVSAIELRTRLTSIGLIIIKTTVPTNPMGSITGLLIKY
jgi:hypothetical protein